MLMMQSAASRPGPPISTSRREGIGGILLPPKKRMIFYSMNREDVMQKPSLGFDYLERFARRIRRHRRDRPPGAAPPLDGTQPYSTRTSALQCLSEVEARPFADIWVGHSRPAIRAFLVFDNHALLLQPLAMMGFGYDRDWGVGFDQATSTGEAPCRLTTGSGMPVYWDGNYLRGPYFVRRAGPGQLQPGFFGGARQDARDDGL